MEASTDSLTKARTGDLAILLALAAARLVLHCATNWQYGFHRDELGVLDDARYLAWGYVSYPPFTPFIARIALILFGPSLVGLRLFAALAQSIAMVFAGLMTRELDGRRWAQVVAALATATAPVSLSMGTLFQYISFDFLWWVMAAYFLIRLLREDNPRWWLAIGAVLGLGMMTKYTMIFFIAGLGAGVLFTPARRYLKSPWLWAGAALSVLIFLPNLIWQTQHHFISLTFLNHIHARDVRIGRTDGFLIGQLTDCANLFTLPLSVAGLYFYLVSPNGRRYRALGWMFAVPLVLFVLARGRSYYLAAAYPMLCAAGAAVWEDWLAARSPRTARVGRAWTWVALGAGAIPGVLLTLPLAPINSPLWRLTSKVHDNFTEQIGWPELAQTIAGIYATLPEKEKPHAAILAGNYGEAGAINLYGRAYHLPEVICGTNTYWWRGYGAEPPEAAILVGFSREDAEQLAGRVELAGHVTNRFAVLNEETRDHPDIFVCRDFKKSWPEFWKNFQRFGERGKIMQRRRSRVRVVGEEETKRKLPNEMLIKVGFDIEFALRGPTPMVLMLFVHPSREGDLRSPQELQVEPKLPVSYYTDLFGNRCARLLAPAGNLRLALETLIEDSGEPDPQSPDAAQHKIENLPNEALAFLMPSRYCEVDKLSDIAWKLFGDTPPGWPRVEAICTWVNQHITFGYHFADPSKSAFDVYQSGEGVCRDFSHLALTFCRCLNIPARYVTGYMGDIGVPVVLPMDFSGWFEVYLGDRWHTFDARHNVPRIGRIVMAVGRDAADVALTTNFGSATLKKFFVISDEVKASTNQGAMRIS